MTYQSDVSLRPKVKQATAADLEHVTGLAMKFNAASSSPPARREEMRSVVSRIIDGGGCFVSEGGMIAGIIAPLYYKPDYLEAHELAWWAEDGTGALLLRRFEAWALESGAHEIVLSTLSEMTRSTAGKLLERKGFVFAEASFRKVL